MLFRYSHIHNYNIDGDIYVKSSINENILTMKKWNYGTLSTPPDQ